MDLVVQTLRNGASQDPNVLKPAEEQLQKWETEAGFFLMLAKITSDFSIEFNVRWLASMYLKNGVDRYWRKMVFNALKEEEKVEIRHCLLQNCDEPYPQIAVQLSTLISRLARLDFPKDWPQLLPTICERTKSNDSLVQERALHTLYRVVCQLASKRLANDRRAFQELTAQLFQYILHLWSCLTDAVLSMDVRCNEFASTLERTRLSAKILHKLVIHGFKKLSPQSEVNVFVENIFQRVKNLMELRKMHESIDNVRERLEKYVVLLTKTMIELLEHHPFAYIQFIRPSIELTLFYLFNPAGEALTFPRLVIQCFNLMKCIIACPEYRNSICSPESDLPETTEAVEIKRELFTSDVCIGICNKLLSKYFILVNEELELWEGNPEEFFSDGEASENGKYNLRAAIENLFIGLFRENLKVLIPFLSKVVEDTNSIVDADDIAAICQKDAIYNIIGMGAFDFFDVIDFDDWFQKTLVNELRIKEPNYRILRRRVTILVGQWISLKFSDQNRLVLYEELIPLLSTDEDLVVRLSAASTLKLAIVNFEFDSAKFLPYLPSIFGLLYELLTEVTECETKLVVLHVMGCLIEYIGTDIKPHLGPLVQYLPLLWVQSQEYNMLRVGILGVLSNLTIGLATDSEKIHGFLISVTQHSTDVNKKSHVYLLQDGLNLWLALIDNCPVQSAEPVLNIFENMLSLLELGSENLPLCIKITTEYIVLCPDEFLARYGQALVNTLQPSMADFFRQREDSICFAKMYEMILRVRPLQGAQLLRPVLHAIVANIVADVDNSSFCEIFSMQFTILSRVVLAAGEVFNSVVTEVASKMLTPAEDLLESLLKKWWTQIALVTQEDRRKVCALALAQLCSNNWPPVLNVWGSCMTSIAEVIFDVTDEDSLEDKLVYTAEYISATPPPTERQHKIRLKDICIRDPVHSVSLRHFLAAQLKTFEQNAGSAVVVELFQVLEEDCKKLLREITATR